MKSILVLKIVIGFMALSLGAVGLLLPIMPTTPFLLLAVGCFSSTPWIQKRVLKVPFVKEYYESYVNGKGIRRETVCSSLAFLWMMLGISIVITKNIMLTALLLVIGIFVSMHIAYLEIRGRKNEG